MTGLRASAAGFCAVTYWFVLADGIAQAFREGTLFIVPFYPVALLAWLGGIHLTVAALRDIREVRNRPEDSDHLKDMVDV